MQPADQTLVPPVERRFPALAVAVLSALAVAVIHLIFVTSVTGRVVDNVAFDGARYGQGRLWQIAEPILDVVSIPFVIAVVLAAAVVALLRRRRLLAIQIAVVMLGANVTTQALKAILIRPELGLADRIANSLPSGHTTVAASAAAALVLASPRKFRAWAALIGAAYTSATGVSTLVGQWHRPADAVAAVFVVLAWGGLVIGLGHPGAGRAGRVRTAAALMAGTGVVVGAASVAAYLHVASAIAATRAVELIAYAGGVLAIGAATLVAFGVLAALASAADPSES